MTPEQRPWECTYEVDFADGGPSLVGTIHRGTLEECQRAHDLFPAIHYNGGRPIRKARLFIHQVEEPLAEIDLAKGLIRP